MKMSFPVVAGLLAGLLIHSAARPAQAGFVLGTFDETRASTANVLGPLATDAIASLNANFPGNTFVTGPTLTAEFLAGVDVLLITSVDTTPDETPTLGITPLSGGEQTALFDFVQAGGRAFLLVDGFAPYLAAGQSMLDPFGMTIVDDGLTGLLNVTPTTNTHPVINGPFGETTSISMVGAGLFTDLGPFATSLATMDATGLPVLAAIENDALGAGSGRVVLMTDTTAFINDDLGGFFSEGETLFLNTIEYLRVPEPSGQSLAALGAGGVGLAVASGLRRRRRLAEMPRGNLPLETATLYDNKCKIGALR